MPCMARRSLCSAEETPKTRKTAQGCKEKAEKENKQGRCHTQSNGGGKRGNHRIAQLLLQNIVDFLYNKVYNKIKENVIFEKETKCKS